MRDEKTEIVKKTFPYAGKRQVSSVRGFGGCGEHWRGAGVRGRKTHILP